MEPSDTVVSVMQKLRERGVHMAPGRLMMKGKNLTPIESVESLEGGAQTRLCWSDETWPHKDKTLQDWGVQKEETLQLIICNLRG